MEPVSFAAAFLAGLVSFASPCVLPLLPVYAAVLAQGQEKGTVSPVSLYLNCACFMLGFALMFVLLGATASLLGQWLFDYQEELRKGGAVLMVLLGVFLMGLWQPRMLMQERRPFLQRRGGGALGAFLLGVALTVGWTPCTGPILAAILLYAGQSGTVYLGAALLFAYALGLAVPFFLLTAVWRQGIAHMKRYYAWLPRLQQTAGGVLVICGVLLWFDAWRLVIGWAYRVF